MFGILIDPLVCDQNTAAAKKHTKKHTHQKPQTINKSVSSIVYSQEEYEMINRAVYDYIQNTSESIYNNQ